MNPEKTFRCGLCSHRGSLEDPARVWTHCPSCGAMVFAEAGPCKVLIAHKSDLTCSKLGELMFALGFSTLRAADGLQAKSLIDLAKPSGLVVDVALEKVLSFHLINDIRQNPDTKSVKIVLVASVFNKAAYKSKPTSLYGADDYVEQHHLFDHLPQKLEKLLGASCAQAPKQASAGTLHKPLDPHTQDSPQDLAHRIISDMLMYKEPTLVQAIQSGSFSSFEPLLQEAQRMFAERSGSGDGPGLVQAAFDRFVHNLRIKITPR